MKAKVNNPPMHVVQVNCARDREGRVGAELLDAWPTLADVASAVAQTGVEVSVLQSSNCNASCERDGVNFHFVAGFAWRLARFIKSLRPDVVHVNGLGFPFHIRAICNEGIPVLVQDHGSAPGGAGRLLKRWGLARISAVAFTSQEQAAPFMKRGMLGARARVFAIPESSTHFRSENKEDARRITGVHGDPAVLWVGHLNENKDPVTILDGFARALGRLPNAQLWYCYQNADLLDVMRARLTKNEPLAAHVHLIGEIEHAKLENYYRAADFFMLGSRRESCGFALLEALACGATPIVTDIPAFRVLTGGGAVGALCPAGDAAAFTAGLVSLARCGRDDLRARAVRHFQAELSFAVLGRKLVAAYQTVADDYAHTKSGRR